MLQPSHSRCCRCALSCCRWPWMVAAHIKLPGHTLPTAQRSCTLCLHAALLDTQPGLLSLLLLAGLLSPLLLAECWQLGDSQVVFALVHEGPCRTDTTQGDAHTHSMHCQPWLVEVVLWWSCVVD